MTDVPLYTECVIGYRHWKIADWVLSPISVGSPWRVGVNHARCQITTSMWAYEAATLKPHDAPHEECHCGLYALHEPPDSFAIAGRDVVLGAVAAWGDLRVHHDGFRAEYAQIVTLVDQDVRSDDLREIAAFYGVPLVPRDLLTMEAERHGQSLPVSVRPEKAESQEYVIAPGGAMYIPSGSVHFGNGNVFTYNTTWTSVVAPPPPPPKRKPSRYERKQSNRQGPSGKRRGPKNIDPGQGWR